MLQPLDRCWMQIIALLLVANVSVQLSRAEEVLEESSRATSNRTLVTHMGDRIPGRWIASENLKTLEWQAEGFVQPFQFGIGELSMIQVRHDTEVPQTKGSYRCELDNGDVLFGTPVAINEAELVFDVPDSGSLRIERPRLRKLSPWSATGQSIRSTPSTLSDWKGSHNGWQEASGRISSIKDDVELRSNLRLSSQSRTSVRIAWEKQPDFRIDIGSNEDWSNGIRLETWHDQLVFVAESPEAAYVALVTKIGNKSGELLLNIFLDSNEQRMLVTTESGATLGEFAWHDKFQSKLRIQARKKGLHFYSATVTSWDGSSPESSLSSQPSVRFKNGKTEYATVEAWDPESATWAIRSQDASEATSREKRVSSNEINAIFFADKPQAHKLDDSKASVRIASRMGMRLTGELARLTDQTVELRCPGMEYPLKISLTNMQSLHFLNEPSLEHTKPPKFPHLRIGNALIRGQLVNGQSDDLATSLVWKPTASKTAAAISHAANGKITYRESPPQVKKKPKKRPAQDTGIFGGIARLFASTNTASKAEQTSSKPSSEPTLHLRSGDSFPCHPKRIDREGVRFTSSVTDATFAPHETIKALVLVGNFRPAQVTEEQRDRLLTLPRIQQEYPPNHLLLSVDGDILRARVTAMNDKFITTEIRLNQVELPRERVAAMAWLHQDEIAREEGESPSANDSDSLLRVQAVQSNGVRLTFTPKEFADEVLSGASEVFGKCKVNMSQVDSILFGQAINDALKHQSHQLLTLKPAITPRFVAADSSTPREIGQGSALVDVEAPPIKLKDLNGIRFDLTELRGKIVVLDFWATWCGPCIQWMPQLEEIVARYSDEEVRLVTINLLQEKEVIERALERMQINPTVLLDLDGVVADAYEANAIPQTVVIDQQGKVSRLFIGGSSQIKQPLIDALDALTSRSGTLRWSAPGWAVEKFNSPPADRAEFLLSIR